MATVLPHFLRDIGYVLLERCGANSFSLISDAPSWFTELWPLSKDARQPFSLAENSPFLENFLAEAESFWQVPQAGFRESGTWIEKSVTRGEIPLDAKAFYVDGKPLLAIHSPDPEFREQVKVLQTARDAALAHERLLREIQKKEILLHCIVHDLSQPLSAMRGSFECLATEHDAERIAKFIDLGKNASEQQEAMIREILKAFAADFQSSLDIQDSENTAPNLLETAKEALASLTPAFDAKGVRGALKDHIGEATNWAVRGEKTRLMRVFTNLLENALRYTPAGSSVTIGMEEDGDLLKAYIDDEGPGLPEDLRPAEIFALFAKGKRSSGKAGLGLYFCRITVERWGGSIGCASLMEKGSRFWFRLPRAVSKPETAADPHEKATLRMPVTKSGQKGPKTTLRILLADDQEDIRILTTHQLNRSGHEVIAVANGQAALDSARSGHFDVILLDEEMPILSGVKVARAIHELQKNQVNRSILVALTGNNTPEDKDRLLAAGFDSVLGKPFRLESLDAFLRNPEKPFESDLHHEEASGADEGNFEAAINRVGGDEKLLKQMIRTFLRETPTRMAAMQKSLQRKNGDQLASVAHALKGSVAIFGAMRAGQQSQSLEYLGSIRDFPEATRVYAILQEDIAKLQQNLRRYAKLEETEPPSNREDEKAGRKIRKLRKH